MAMGTATGTPWAPDPGRRWAAGTGTGTGDGAGSGAPRSFSNTSVPNSSETVRSSTPAEVRVALDLGWGRRVTRMYMGWSLQTPRSCSLTSAPPAPRVPSTAHQGVKSPFSSKNSIL